MEYQVGILYINDDTRIENNIRVKMIADYFKESNSLNSVKLTYFDCTNNFDFILHPYIKIWITAFTDITSLIYVFFIENPEHILISICDDKYSYKVYPNIIHLNNSDIGQMLQLLSTVFTYIKANDGGTFINMYVFYDNINFSYEKYFRLNAQIYNSDFNSNPIQIKYCNTDNTIEYDTTILQITMDVSEGTITNINTLFVYLTKDFRPYFKVYSIVESPLSIKSDTNLLSSVRHICATNSYINSSYYDIYNLMKEYIIPNNFCNDESELNTFFNTSLRMTIFAPVLSRYEIERYNYINYVLYIKNPVSVTFLQNNRITIFSILMEKALKIAAWLSYRNIPMLSTLSTKGILIDGKLFGPPNFDFTKNPIDNYWFNRLVYYTFEPKTMYYITKIDITRNNSVVNTKNENMNIRAGIYIYTPPEISTIPISLAQGISSIGGDKVIVSE
jgi:hypothetical protein